MLAIWASSAISLVRAMASCSCRFAASSSFLAAASASSDELALGDVRQDPFDAHRLPQAVIDDVTADENRDLRAVGALHPDLVAVHMAGWFSPSCRSARSPGLDVQILVRC